MPQSDETGMDVSRCVLIAGPTAVGKSEVAMRLASKLGGEIVSVDSMQVYRGMDIGTAKPSREDRKNAPHHLIDVADIRERFDAAQFVRLAEPAIRDIQKRDRFPILCGGTGLYFQALLEGLGDAPSSDPGLREKLEKTSLTELLDELKVRDRETYESIDRQNPRRVVRAVEVIRLTGRPFSEQRSEWRRTERETPLFFGLERPREELNRRINLRVDQMFERGLVEETRRLIEQGLAENPFAMQAIGYRQVVEHLQGERSLGETIKLVKTRTRQFAKRQMTWFKNQARLQWISLPGNSDVGECVETILKAALPQSGGN